jgi:hypothetical protein
MVGNELAMKSSLVQRGMRKKRKRANFLGIVYWEKINRK